MLSVDPPLCSGTTWAVFRTTGVLPVLSVRLNIWAMHVVIQGALRLGRWGLRLSSAAHCLMFILTSALNTEDRAGKAPSAGSEEEYTVEIGIDGEQSWPGFSSTAYSLW